jgi:hypothetical protein
MMISPHRRKAFGSTPVLRWAVPAFAALAALSSSLPVAAQLTVTGMGGPARPPASSVDLAPFVAALLPIVAPIIVSVAGAALWLCATIARWIGAKHAQAGEDGARAKLVAAAEREANILIAGAADNLAHRSIDVGSPAIASAATLIGVELPAAIARLGITPAGVERLVVSAVGQTQTAMTRLDPAALPQPKAA